MGVFVDNDQHSLFSDWSIRKLSFSVANVLWQK